MFTCLAAGNRTLKLYKQTETSVEEQQHVRNQSSEILDWSGILNAASGHSLPYQCSSKAQTGEEEYFFF